MVKHRLAAILELLATALRGLRFQSFQDLQAPPLVDHRRAGTGDLSAVLLSVHGGLGLRPPFGLP
jgi:hypothetical protein